MIKGSVLGSSCCGATGSARSLESWNSFHRGPAQLVKDPVWPQLHCKSQLWLGSGLGTQMLQSGQKGRKKKQCLRKMNQTDVCRINGEENKNLDARVPIMA